MEYVTNLDNFYFDREDLLNLLIWLFNAEN